MAFNLCSFASGSSGNCYLVGDGRHTVLIDAGISTRRIHQSLEKVGIDRREIQGVFVTHEHTDHVKGLRVLTKKNPEWKVFASAGTAEQISSSIYSESQLERFRPGDTIEVGNLQVRSIRISHDAADPVCYTIRSGETRALILTDTGYVPEEAASYLGQSDLIVLEANHEVNMLKAGRYPYRLKCRILGDQGHLSNEAAGEALASALLDDGRFRKIFLAHLSSENNFPGLALQTVKNILEEHQLIQDRHFTLEVMHRDDISGLTSL